MSRVTTLAVVFFLMVSSALAQVSDSAELVEAYESPVIRLADGEYTTSLPRGEVAELVFVTICKDDPFDLCPVEMYDFGTVAIGAPGPYHTTELRNEQNELVNTLLLLNLSKTASATGLSIEINGPFEWSPPPTFGGCRGLAELGPGETCQTVVRFAPTEPGPAFGEIMMFSAEEGEASVMLQGTGGDDILLYGQFQDWESLPSHQFVTVRIGRHTNPALDSELADDFVVEGPDEWTINTIGLGYFDSVISLRMPMFDIYIVLDDEGYPGEDVVCAAPESEIVWYDPQIDRHTEIVLSKPCILAPGHYWLRARPVVPGGPWEQSFGILQYVTAVPPEGMPIHLNPPVWRNPGGSINASCPNWTYLYPQACTLLFSPPVYGAVFWLIGEVLQAPEPPENDNMADAIIIPTDDATYEGTNVDATLEDGEPEASCTFGSWTTNFSVWWTFTAEKDGQVTINTFDSDFDTVLSLHRADDLSEVACDDDTNGLQSQIEAAEIVEGETYLIRVSGYDQSSNNQGTIQLSLEFDFGSDEPSPENDHMANAIVIPIVNAGHTGTNVNATLEEGEPEASCTFEDWTTNYSVWWTFTADEEANRVTIDTFGSEFDTILSLHRADNLDEVVCDDDTDGLQSQIENALIVSGETYLIRVSGYDQSSVNQGDIQLTTAFHWVSGEDGPNDIVQGLTHPSPNPVRERTTFDLTVDRGQQVTVEVFDVMGRRVQVLYEGSLVTGATESLTLDASRLPSGAYVIRALGEDFVDTRRVMVVH